jgi:protein phosphatase
MGTTLVACVVVADRVFGVSVGDSRTYLLRDDQLTLFTHDQTLAAEYVGRGLLTGEQAKTSPFRSVLLQCLGHSLALKPERFEAALSRGDRLLLCSDGLHGVVDDETLRRLLGQGSAETAAASLIDAANAAGGPDNISVIVVEPL